MGCAVVMKLYICCWLRKVVEMFGRRLLLRAGLCFQRQISDTSEL